MQNEANPVGVLLVQSLLALLQVLLLGLQAYLSQKGWTKRNGWHPPGSENLTSRPASARPSPSGPGGAPPGNPAGYCPACRRPLETPPLGP